ncbi:MAG: hypothetical protein R3C53_00945 [Pirellulaceae bacterium]
MGDLRFKFSGASGMDPRVWNTAYITGIEGIPWQCHHHVSGDQFSIGREIDESGKLNIVWPTRGSGNICLSTTSLRVTPEPYSLIVEIARGTISRLKNQTSEWQRVGLKLPEGFFPLAEESLSQFLHAVTAGDDDRRKNACAQAAIDLAMEASVLLCNAFALQALEARRQSEGRQSTLLGVALRTEIELTSIGGAVDTAFNLVQISPDLGSVESASGKRNFAPYDTQLEWATSLNKKVCIGPLVNFRKGSLPQWMILLNEEFDSVLDAACIHARTTVERYLGRTHIWNCAAGLNAPTELGWTDEEVLRMAVSLIETVRRADHRNPVLLTIDQPWSEYLRNDANGISPLHFADALIRADLGLSGLALELNFDQWPDGSFPRDPIDLSRLIDRWAMLGLPLLVIVTSPTETNMEADRVSSWRTEYGQGVIDPDMILKLLISKPSVHAVIWNHLTDQVPQPTAGSGLWDMRGKAKPLLSQLAQLRKNYLH